MLDGVDVGSVNPISVTMDSDHSLTAVFTESAPPLVEPTCEEHTIQFEENEYVVKTCSNSSISEIHFNQAQKTISLTVDGSAGTTGFCNITIPSELMSGDFSIYMDDESLLENVDYTKTYNGTHYLFDITYVHSTHTIKIISTEVISEFQLSGLIIIIAIATIAIVRARQKLEKSQNTNKIGKNRNLPN
jgi:hypothetical protein